MNSGNTKKSLGVHTKQQAKQKLKQVIAVFSAFAIMLTAGFFLYFNIAAKQEARAAVTGDYRSKVTGSWTTAATWERYNGSAWVAAVSSPISTDGVITIQNGHTVTISAGVLADQIVINSGGQVTLSSGAILSLNNGTGTDMDVSGIFKNSGTISYSSGATVVFQSTGKYQHNFSSSAGTIPTATWSAGSTCEILNINSGSAPSGISQSFSNFTWNCPAQGSDINLGGGLTTILKDFTITSTGSRELMLATTASSLTVGGNFLMSAGTFILSRQDNVNFTFTVSGSYTQTGGTFNTVDKDHQTGTINVSDNWSHTGGTIKVNKPGSNVDVRFVKAGQQTFTASSNTVTGNIDFTVVSGSTLVMGSNIMTGRNFTLSSGAELQIGSAAGITTSGLTGNIQVTGTRSFNAGANYTYNCSTAAQVTGNGLPAAINNLTVNNSYNLTLSNTVSVNNILTFTTGKILTGTYQLYSTNSSAAGITGYSSSKYVIGFLKRNVAGTGTYDFPVGTSSYYELASVTLAAATGFTNILASFTNTNPVTAALPLSGVTVNGLSIDQMLNYGYWTLTPGGAMTGGTYSVTVKEQGYTPPNAGRSYCLLKRTDVNSPWQSLGTHDYNTQSEISGVVTAARSALTSFSDFSVGYGEYLQFKNPTLLSGTDGQENAIYIFSDVCTNVDAWIQILKLVKGATLADIDHFSAGYDEAWQPFINAVPGDTSSIKWLLTFKVSGTSRDTSLPNIAIAAVDVDGDAAYLKEFVEANNIYSYSIGSPTNLTITNNSGNYRATSTIANVADIDTAHHECIFQINYRNVRSFTYQTGAISTYSAIETRQNCLYFHYFFNGNVALPVSLINFTAKNNGDKVDVLWSTAAETNNDYFTVERSADGKEFTELERVKGSGSTNTVHNYSTVDKNPLRGKSYYRLKQKDYNGKTDVFKMVAIDRGIEEAAPASFNFYPNPFRDSFTAELKADYEEEIEISVLNIQGAVLYSEKFMTQVGENKFHCNPPVALKEGTYIVRITKSKTVLTSRKIVCSKN